jgi:hypothetical protein
LLWSRIHHGNRSRSRELDQLSETHPTILVSELGGGWFLPAVVGSRLLLPFTAGRAPSGGRNSGAVLSAYSSAPQSSWECGRRVPDILEQ